MKKFRICVFDIILVVLAVLALGGIRILTGQSSVKTGITAEELQNDLVRVAEREVNLEKLHKVDYYNVELRLEMTAIDNAYCARLTPGMGLVENYSGSDMGTLEDYEITDLGDGTSDVVLKIRVYAPTTSTDIRTPGDVVLKVGTDLYLKDTEGKYLGDGFITWISH